MKLKIKRKLFFLLMILSYSLLSYNKWWLASAGFLLIVFFSYLIWNKEFLQNTGLKLNCPTVIKSIILASVVTFCSLLVMRYLALKQSVEISFTSWNDYYHAFFYTLNEEIVLGAIILFSMVRKRKFSPIIASLGLAILFSFIHFAIYKWIFNDRGILMASTLLTLFLVGFVRNNLILATGHIGFSWALHFGWIVVMFGCMHTDLSTNLRVPEPERFNMYLGSIEMLIISFVISCLSIVYWARMRNSFHSIFNSNAENY